MISFALNVFIELISGVAKAADGPVGPSIGGPGGRSDRDSPIERLRFRARVQSTSVAARTSGQRYGRRARAVGDDEEVIDVGATAESAADQSMAGRLGLPSWSPGWVAGWLAGWLALRGWVACTVGSAPS